MIFYTSFWSNPGQDSHYKKLEALLRIAAHYGILWHTMVHNDAQQSTTAHNSAQWHTTVHYSALQCTMVLYCALQSTTAYYDLL